MEKVFPNEPYKDIFNNSPAAMLIVATDAPIYTMLEVNNAYLAATNTTREELIGKGVFAVFPGNPTDEESKNIERTYYSFGMAISEKQPHTMSNYRYDIPIPGTPDFEERYWTTTNTPVLDKEGNVKYFIHSPLNVTELYKLRESEKASVEAVKEQREQLFSTFMQAPVAIEILKGPDHVVELINPPLCKIYDISLESILGKPIFEVFPHLRDFGFRELLTEVMQTGKHHQGVAVPVPLMIRGKMQNVFCDFVMEPFREADGTISGVIAVVRDVTEEVRIRKSAEEAEQRARLAVDSVGLGTFDLDLLTGVIVTSTRVANIFGYDEPVPREMYVKLYHQDDLAIREKAHEEAIRTGKLFYESRVVQPDKSIKWIRVEGKVHYDANGKAYRILGTLLDITQEKTWAEEQRKLVMLVDNSVDLVSILTLEGVNSYINAAGMLLLGFDSIEEVKSTSFSELHTPEDFKWVTENVISTVMSAGRWSGVMNVRHLKTREVFPVFNNCFRIDDPITGDPIAVGAVMRDLRPELFAKKALADSEELLQKITSAAPTALWMSDENGQITYVNKAWIDWTGHSFQENMGMQWLRSIAQQDREKVKNRWIVDHEHRHIYEVEFRLDHVDGTVHWCIGHGQPQFRPDGSFAGFVGTCVDITEQKHVQQQKDDFIGIASHELKTPVTSIKGYAQVLEKMLIRKGDMKEAQLMNRMDVQVNRLTSLIGDLLDVTKINAGKLQFNDTEFDFNMMVHDSLEDLQRVTEKHVLVEAFQETGLVYGDRERIGQVISNLVTNAIKYSPFSEKIVIHTSLENDEVVLCVEDFGIGIPSDKLEKVFEQFYRVSGDMQHTFPGLGLGLYISSEIVKREGGRIWVTSEEGKGSTFCFSIPVHGVLNRLKDNKGTI